MKGLVIKKHSNFYYVRSFDDEKVYECMLRERLKKENIEILAGDIVEIEEAKQDSLQAVISNNEERYSYISRPNIANMDQNIIVISLNKPAVNLLTIDRFIIHSQLSGLKTVLCINKCDLKDKKKLLPAIKDIYNPLGIEILEISALNLTGMNSLKETLKNKKSVLSGPSGVGKSTIINALKPGLNLRVGFVGNKSEKGTHTTRHSELIYLADNDPAEGIIADTPGFSYLKFDQNLPEEIEKQFLEFIPYKNDCYYNDCIHLNETDCNVKANLCSIPPSRYESYCKFIEEAFKYKEYLSSSSTKDEGMTKTIDASGKNQIRRLKLGYELVDSSRKSSKQKLSTIRTTENTDECETDSIDY